MFDRLAHELGQQYGLGNRAKSFIQMLLGAMIDAHGDIGDFVRKLRATGEDWDRLLDGWLAGPSTAPTLALSDAQLDSAFGDTPLLGQLSSRFGLPPEVVRRAVADAVPTIVRQYIGQGVFVGAQPQVAAYLSAPTSPATAATPAGAPIPTASQGGWPAWLPWAVLAIVAALVVAYCNVLRQPAGESAPALTAVPAPSASQPPAELPSADPASAAAAATEPAGAGLINWMFNDAPALKVYFDVGQAAVAAEFPAHARELIDYLMIHGDARARLTGFNDPTGDPARNAALAKARAQAVQAALVAAGVPAERTELVKPADATDGSVSNAAARRVEVTIIR